MRMIMLVRKPWLPASGAWLLRWYHCTYPQGTRRPQKNRDRNQLRTITTLNQCSGTFFYFVASKLVQDADAHLFGQKCSF